ncbi:hypothetical protein CPB83DRAFT_857411 [Crepidotus variabilis]|uniref:Uncharacterized protein n=1 Tax=Crepidotus variabilis TaxID=179855 RepID=A0A9P6ED84_9AGAR|nr:hypothetical protein CPB83DRAFT_857411 [Crepidotus variabilis]
MLNASRFLATSGSTEATEGSDDRDKPEDVEAKDDAQDDEVDLQMLEAFAAVESLRKGKEPLRGQSDSLPHQTPPKVLVLQNMITAPPNLTNEYTRIKKDAFHAFHMLPIPVNHGLRAAFLRALRDHMLRWDPVSKELVGAVCIERFGLTFDQMLVCNPCFIAERVPRHIPPPSILTPGIEHVYNMFRGGIDAKTQVPLFTPQFEAKAEAVLDLARKGYLSDMVDIPMYERAGVNKYGLQKWKCVRGTNKVEGGPHGDIYREFGALHAGPRLTTNCLTDHRTWYNLQAQAKHQYGVDWEYHHNLGLINRVSFLLNYMSDAISGAVSYADWVNGDLFEHTSEQFGICTFPEPLRNRLAMKLYSEEAAAAAPLNRSETWLRKRQGLALPVLPPTTPEARKYFFRRIRHFADQASLNGKQHIDFEAFAREWNESADGKDWFYVTVEVLANDAKSWEKSSNIQASEQLIPQEMKNIQISKQVFAAPNTPFPEYLLSAASQSHPCYGALEIFDSDQVPESVSIKTSLSKPIHHHVSALMRQEAPGFFVPDAPSRFVFGAQPASNLAANSAASSTSTLTNSHRTHATTNDANSTRPTKRRRLVPDNLRKRSVRTCRRCSQAECPGNSDIFNCSLPCTNPCRKCGRLEGCRGIDGGKTCSWAG